ncbi:7-cyano-7-deazaguanine synthase [Bradyrhizobium sp. BR 10289]|uniref:7-cyano-7-deazaguanine synthase n=1 Tax=Bradyrhizobium sp. BR 10289 TaxID=2749993 RepID=UPI001C64516A|nr:7-cyano-7-deazaguanine synthase [Bradyrhizobium sp. BR 10289]MBW7969457.1 7-cyano-7-deazaguanine synthase [Bradyrhizobium sp. BR 10289]
MHASVLFSGGIDSTSCVHFFKKRGHEVRGIFVDFGQAAARCEDAAVDVLSEKLSIPVIKLKVSSSTKFGAGELIGRNLFLIASAILLGSCHDGLLAIGIHSGTNYYDCSRSFLSRVEVLAQECSDGRVAVVAPFVDWSKDDVFSYFKAAALPLNDTYSCEAGGIPPCGTCASCRDRVRLYAG